MVEPLDATLLFVQVVVLPNHAFPADVPAVSLSVNELSALYLGGVSAVLLADAGRVRELTPGAALAVDAILRAARAPWLSVWF